MKRREIREVLFKLLFRAEFNEASEMPEQMQLFFNVDFDEKEVSEEDKAYIIKREADILEKLPEIDKQN